LFSFFLPLPPSRPPPTIPEPREAPEFIEEIRSTVLDEDESDV
jgi:hypothetical protein